MSFDWGTMLAIFLAIVTASVAEHFIIAPLSAHSPPHTVGAALGSIAAPPQTVDDYVRSKYPNATTI